MYYYTFSSAAGSKHLWHPIVSTGACDSLRIERMLFRVCIQFTGCHFCCFVGDSSGNSSGLVVGVSNLIGRSLFLSTSNRRGAGGFSSTTVDPDEPVADLLMGFSYSILILFRVRLGEKYGEAVVRGSVGSVYKEVIVSILYLN